MPDIIFENLAHSRVGQPRALNHLARRSHWRLTSNGGRQWPRVFRCLVVATIVVTNLVDSDDTRFIARVYSPAPLINSFLPDNLFEHRFHPLFNPHVAPNFPLSFTAFHSKSYLICCRWYIDEYRLFIEIDRIIIWTTIKIISRLFGRISRGNGCASSCCDFLRSRNSIENRLTYSRRAVGAMLKNAKIFPSDIDCVKLRWIVYLYSQTLSTERTNWVMFHEK